LAIYDRALSESEVRLHYRSVAFGDTDEDGMPDFWEIPNNLNPLVNDADADADDDDSKNLAEYQQQTDPQDPDTDDDGLKDGVETGTGQWVDADDRGTNPRAQDSDGDGFLDNVETNTGDYVNDSDTGTSPLSVDTDGDLFKDPDEVAFGTNPSDPASQPAAAENWVAAIQADAPQYWWRFEGASVNAGVANEGSVSGFDGAYGTGILDADLGKASATEDLGVAVEFTGPAADNATTKFVDFGQPIPELINLRSAPEDGKATSVEYWFKTSHVGTHSVNAWQSPAVFGHESPGDGDMYWGWINADGDFGFSTSDIQETTAAGLADGNWHHAMMVKVWNQESPSLSRLYVDGGALSGGWTFEAETPAGDPSFQDDDAPIQFLGFTEAGELENVQFIGYLDEVAIYSEALLEAHARIHYVAAGVAPATFAITNVGLSEGGNVTITWESTPGATYVVQRTEAVPAASWADVSEVEAAGASTEFEDTTQPQDASTLFYRVERR
jgi:hypothetical protein